MRRVFIAILPMLLLVGCASQEARDSNFSSQDIMFAEMMIPHHEQAIEMSELALTRSTNPEVIALAVDIRDAQEPEIKLMRNWPGVDASSHMGHSMMGMLDEEELAQLESTKGMKFDRLFLEGMIKHHEGAIEMAEMVAESTNSEVAALAKSIIDSQSAEIDVMKALLNK